MGLFPFPYSRVVFFGGFSSPSPNFGVRPSGPALPSPFVSLVGVYLSQLS